MGKSGGGGGGGARGSTASDIAAYQAELMGAPQAQANAIPNAVGLERGIMPGLQSYYFDTMNSTQKGLGNMYGGMEGSSIQNQGRYGQALTEMYGQMGAGATNAARNSLSSSVGNIYDTFTSQAANDLALGSQLNKQETDIAQGAARAQAQARGLQFSRQGGDLEILNTYQMGQRRQAERRQTAGQAYQMGRDLQTYGGQAYLSPAMNTSAIYSIPGMMQGANEAIGSFGPRILQPESQYLANIRATRLQGEAARDQANATRQAGSDSMWGSIIGGGIALLCWVAREVYGNDNYKWIVFREWLTTDAPKWLLKLYTKHGESFAKFISNKPILKRIVRFAMDIIVNRELKKLNTYANS